MFGRSNLTLVAGSIVQGSIGDAKIENAITVVLIQRKSWKTYDFVAETQCETVLHPLYLSGQVFHLTAQHHFVSNAGFHIVRCDTEGLLRNFHYGGIAADDEPAEECWKRESK